MKESDEAKLDAITHLESLCRKCQGKGEVDRENCGWCNGSGYETTELGEMIVDLMRHNFRPMLEDAMKK
jgi:DnaJ-class molecular chaperone